MRHLGREREVSTEQATLDKRVLRTLFRHGPQLEGTLCGKCSQKMSAPAWRDAVTRLIAWGFVSIESSGHGNSNVVALTREGTEWGEELACIANAEILEAVK